MKPAVKEIKEFLDFGFDFQEAIVASKQDDGKVTRRDIPKFFPVLMSAGPAFTGLDNPRELYSQLSEEDKQELRLYAKERFDLEDDMLEMLIEDTLDELAGDIRVAKRWIKYLNKDKAA